MKYLSLISIKANNSSVLTIYLNIETNGIDNQLAARGCTR